MARPPGGVVHPTGDPDATIVLVVLFHVKQLAGQIEMFHVKQRCENRHHGGVSRETPLNFFANSLLCY